MASEKKLVVTVCGGGNGAHALAGLAAALPDIETRVLTLYADEADRWSAAMETSGLTVSFVNEGSDGVKITSKPTLVTKEAQKAIKGSDIIVLVVPAFAHEQYLNAIDPYVQPGVTLVGLPGQAGFEYAIQGIFGDKAKDVTIMNFESLPWACRVKEFGKVIEVLGRKKVLEGGMKKGNVLPKTDPLFTLQTLLGAEPQLKIQGRLIDITIASANAYVHPAVLYGRWHDWDGQPVEEPPLFYNGITDDALDAIVDMTKELSALKDCIDNVFTGRGREVLWKYVSIHDWIVARYADLVEDKSSLESTFKSNRAFRGLRHPMKETPEGKFVPNFQERYTTEDIPYGLVVLRGIAEIAGIPTPAIDKVLLWAQSVSGKEYLVDGRLQGKDMKDTRSPQRYGFNTLDEIIGE